MPCPHGNSSSELCPICKQINQCLSRHPSPQGNTPHLQRPVISPTMQPRMNAAVSRSPIIPSSSQQNVNVPNMKGAEHLREFEKDLRERNRWFTEAKSSTLGLLNFLDSNKQNPVPFSLETAKSKCYNPYDVRLTKYEDAIKSLVRAWGTNQTYVRIPQQVVSGCRGNRDDIQIAKNALASLQDIIVMDADSYRQISSQQAVEMCQKMRDTQKHKEFLATQLAIVNDLDKWIILGKKTKQLKMGNCQQCMAAALVELINNQNWSSPIELVHTGKDRSGHHFLVVNRPGAGKLPIKNTNNWGESYSVDLWMQNLQRPNFTGGVQLCKEYEWIQSKLEELVVDSFWEKL
jgi:hypothetical protein